MISYPIPHLLKVITISTYGKHIEAILDGHYEETETRAIGSSGAGPRKQGGEPSLRGQCKKLWKAQGSKTHPYSSCSGAVGSSIGIISWFKSFYFRKDPIQNIKMDLRRLVSFIYRKDLFFPWEGETSKISGNKLGQIVGERMRVAI